MTTTAKDLITAAFGHRTANDPTRLAKKPELIRVLDRKLLAVYSEAATINPWYFSKVTNVTPATSEWAEPADAVGGPLRVYGGGDAGSGANAELGGGTDPEDDHVRVTVIGDKEASFPPRVYQIGRAFISVGETGDPSADTNGDKLNVLHAYIHATLDPSVAWDHANNTLEAAWPERFNDLLVLPLARYLAVKDGRSPAELAAYDTELATLRAVFRATLEQLPRGTTARHGISPRTVGQTTRPA